MSRHLVEWLLVNPIDLPPVENVGTDRAWRVLMALANRADETTGRMYASDRTQERDTGLNRRGVIQPVRQVLEQAGWLVDTGKRQARGVKVYELVVPGYCRPTSSGEGDLATKTVDNQVSGEASGSGSGLGSGEGDLAQTEQNRTTPLTPQKGERRKRPAGEKELSTEGSELLTQLLDSEDYSGARSVTAVRATKRREYLPIVQAWERERPNADPVTWCRAQLRGYAPKPVQHHTDQLPTGSPDCPHGCEGQGFHQFYDSEVMHQVTRKCVCAGGTYSLIDTHQATTERVSADKASNTYIPAPGAQADPQSDPVQELSRQLRAV